MNKDANKAAKLDQITNFRPIFRFCNPLENGNFSDVFMGY